MAGRSDPGKTLIAGPQGFKPDIVLMHLGTNDIGSHQDIIETVTELERIIAILRKHNPGVTILLAQILPVAFSYANIRIMSFNDALPELAKSLNSEKSPHNRCKSF